jgi:hypothetical protein
MAQLNKAALAEHWAKNFFSGNVESKSEEWTYRTGTLACIKGVVSFFFFNHFVNRFISRYLFLYFYLFIL